MDIVMYGILKAWLQNKINAGELVGPQGPVGPKGDAGPKGDKGEKGDTGKGLTILGYHNTPEELQSAVTTPNSGDAYGVGTEAPYDIYIWDGTKWVNNGKLQGAQGLQGIQGLKGEKGDPGPQGKQGVQGVQGPIGPSGKTAFQYAQEGGYSGTEDEFKTLFNNVMRKDQDVSKIFVAQMQPESWVSVSEGIYKQPIANAAIIAASKVNVAPNTKESIKQLMEAGVTTLIAENTDGNAAILLYGEKPSFAFDLQIEVVPIKGV